MHSDLLDQSTQLLNASLFTVENPNDTIIHDDTATLDGIQPIAETEFYNAE